MLYMLCWKFVKQICDSTTYLPITPPTKISGNMPQNTCHELQRRAAADPIKYAHSSTSNKVAKSYNLK